MSYILDALKKAERDRHLGQAPNRNSLLQQSLPQPQSQRNHLLMAWILAGLLAAGIILWPQAKQRLTAEPESVLPATPEPELKLMVSPDSPSPSNTEPAGAAPAGAAPAGAASVATPSSVVISEQALEVAEPIPYRQLNQAIRAQLGSLNLDLHVYGNAPEQRFVLINSRRYQTGDWLHEGPLLEAITSDGVILSFQSQRFTLNP